MSAVTTPSVTAALTPRTTPRGVSGARWALLAALAIGAAGGAGASAALVHSQVRVVHDVRTVFVPVPADPAAAASGNVQRKV